ncbi:uncharacterized protein LOC117576392 [Drosophila albomicans]|uniref:Uncharacterized protein LOC117576392 n=1 Tax=Drosophila albomicans TaxID=7291 RepID=A0A6P8XKC1_DROAB|nr:uncharacterized protein LOC117576392 [Drosophila albomicans]
MQLLQLLLPLLVLVCIPLTIAFEIQDTLNIIHDVDVIARAVRSHIEDLGAKTGDTDINNIQDNHNNVLEHFKAVDKLINQARMNYSHFGTHIVESISDFIVDDVLATIQINEITHAINKISMRYDQIVAYEARKESLEINTLISFAEWAALPSAESVQHSMERLGFTLFGRIQNATDFKPTSRILVNRIMKSYEESLQQRCSTRLSPQQFLYSLYAEIALIELKGYTLMEFSTMILRVSDLGNFINETELFRLNHKKRTEHALNVLRHEMQQADRSFWRCDPPEHVAKVTYDEVTRLLQGYIENEDGLNADRTCKRTCDAYQDTRVSGCISDSFCSSQPQCSGRVHDCRFIDSKMWVCQSPQMSTRRYEYIQYENGQDLGHRKACGRGTNKVDSWWRWLFWHCSFCFCLCDEQSTKSDRYFNLRETVSDVEANKVVTGVRIIKKNRIFHLQIQQGQLLPRGVINESTVHWKPVHDYYISGWNVKQGVDYHAMSYHSRAIDLGDVDNRNDVSFVVTGVQFVLINGKLKLRVVFSKFDFESGKVMGSDWLSIRTISGEQLNLQNLDIPTLSGASSKVLSNGYQHLKFVNTGVQKDAAQTTIPFIDIQDVVASHSTPLHGIGIYYKGTPGYGGFIAPKIINYDYSPHIGMPITQP